MRPMQATIIMTSTDAYDAAGLAGLGLIQATMPCMRTALADWRLVEVIVPWTG